MTNTTKNTPPSNDEAAEPKKAPTARTPAVVGPTAKSPGDEPETVVLAQHLVIDGKPYKPGAKVHVWPDYARRLRAQGWVARSR